MKIVTSQPLCKKTNTVTIQDEVFTRNSVYLVDGNGEIRYVAISRFNAELIITVPLYNLLHASQVVNAGAKGLRGDRLELYNDSFAKVMHFYATAKESEQNALELII